MATVAGTTSAPTAPTPTDRARSRARALALAAAAALAGAALPPAEADAQALAQTPAGPARVFQAAGPNGASIQGTVDAYREALGTLNANNPGSVGSGRREINWDGVPDEASDPNAFPPDFFNAPLPGRARGAVFANRAGSGFLVSADADNPTRTPPRFDRLNPGYRLIFSTFSRERLFTALGRGSGRGGNVTEVRFFVPGEATPALSRGFGAVFTDVDLARRTRIEYFDAAGRLLRRQNVPPAPGSRSNSFAGVDFGRPVVARVRITSGNAPLGADDAPGRGRDVVVMDDFLYGEPVAAR
jgi:hypothetical protein